MLGDVGVDGEGQVVGDIGGDEDGIEEGEVVRDYDHAIPGLVHMLDPGDLHPVDEVQEPGDQGLGQGPGEEAQDVDRDHGVDQGQHQEEPGDVDPRGE